MMSGGIDLQGRAGGPMTFQPRTGAWSGVRPISTASA